MSKALQMQTRSLHREPLVRGELALQTTNSESIGAEPDADRSGRGYDIGSFELVRAFVEQLGSRASSGDGACDTVRAIDWATIEAAVADAATLELAIGRAIAIADRMYRESPGSSGTVVRSEEKIDRRSAVTPASLEVEEPFFSFSVADATPDFGEDRLRSRMAKRVGRLVRKAS
jgi:hypothetical protein